jgi:hypothetical protein
LRTAAQDPVTGAGRHSRAAAPKPKLQAAQLSPQQIGAVFRRCLPSEMTSCPISQVPARGRRRRRLGPADSEDDELRRSSLCRARGRRRSSSDCRIQHTASQSEELLLQFHLRPPLTRKDLKETPSHGFRLTTPISNLNVIGKRQIEFGLPAAAAFLPPFTTMEFNQVHAQL